MDCCLIVLGGDYYCFSLPLIRRGFVGAVSDRGVLCLVGELDGECALGVGIWVEGVRDDVEHAVALGFSVARDKQ